jgi:hypothetical protein
MPLRAHYERQRRLRISRSVRSDAVRRYVSLQWPPREIHSGCASVAPPAPLVPGQESHCRKCRKTQPHPTMRRLECRHCGRRMSHNLGTPYGLFGRWHISQDPSPAVPYLPAAEAWPQRRSQRLQRLRCGSLAPMPRTITTLHGDSRGFKGKGSNYNRRNVRRFSGRAQLM